TRHPFDALAAAKCPSPRSRVRAASRALPNEPSACTAVISDRSMAQIGAEGSERG
ncbi:hypothetical protein HPB47_006106, partial [Ixodes persulcatus]